MLRNLLIYLSNLILIIVLAGAKPINNSDIGKKNFERKITYYITGEDYKNIIKNSFIRINNNRYDVAINSFRQHSNSICVIIVDAKKMEKDGDIAIANIGYRSRNNFFAYPDNIIFIDIEILDTMAKVSAIQASANFNRKLSLSEIDTKKDFSEIDFRSISHERYDAISSSLYDNVEDLNDPRCTINSVFNDQIRHAILDLNKLDGFLSKILIPILLHEIDHLNKSGRINSNMGNKQSYLLSEIEADKYSSDMTSELLGQSTRSFDDINDFEEQENQVLALLRYMKYSYYAKSFYRTLGLSQFDNFATLILRNGKSNKRQNIYTEVVAGFFNSIPIMTEGEYLSIKKKYNTPNDWYPNVIEKMGSLFNSVKSKSIYEHEFSPLFLFYKSFSKEISKNDAFKIFGLNRFSDTIIAQIKPERIVNAYSGTYNFNKSAFYDKTMCNIGKDNKRKNVIIVFGKENIYYIRMIMNTVFNESSKNNHGDIIKMCEIFGVSRKNIDIVIKNYQEVSEGTKYNVNINIGFCYLNIRRINYSENISLSFVSWVWEPEKKASLNNIRNMFLY